MEKAQVNIDAATQKHIDGWLNGDYPEETKLAIKQLAQKNPEELLDAFYRSLDFGTGGLRGIMGVGTNRMNVFTVGFATQGLANYLLKLPGEEHKKVFIGYDCRLNSRTFAEEAAKVLAANGIEVYIYENLRPVANISFGVLHKKCTAGIMITASHNPPQYNGYKVYWSYGGQVLPPHDQGIIDEVKKINTPALVKTGPLDTSLIHWVGEEIDKAYLKAIHEWKLHPGDNQTHGKKLNVIYTSLHGGGVTMIPRALKEWGFSNVTLVEKQCIPDGTFPTVKSPNPEEHATLQLGIEKLQATGGDLLLATDPDTDRLAIVVFHKGKPFYFDGNQTACLLAEHLCSSLATSLSLPAKGVFIKTIVTSELLKKIAEHHSLSCLDVLTGFKYIGEKIYQWEEEMGAGVAHHHFILGAEESYGYLIGTHVRDKDAIIASALICEAALQLKLKKQTLVDLLYAIYQKYGVHREKLLSFTLQGKEGADKIKAIMESLRKNPPSHIAGIEIATIEDYLNHTITHLSSKHQEPLLLPKSNVLRFWLTDGTKLVIRPSGTEPKIKLYCALHEKHHLSDQHALEKVIESADRRLDILLTSFKNTLFS